MAILISRTAKRDALLIILPIGMLPQALEIQSGVAGLSLAIATRRMEEGQRIA
jgi:hypothetical protein